MHTKESYMAPKAEVMVVRPESGLLIGSVGGAESEGFTTAGEYSDDDWSIN